MNVLIRADSSSNIGTGHIMRCLVLAKEFKDDNVVFATQDLEANINYKITENGYKLKSLKSNNIDELDRLLKKLEINLLVIDSYDIDFEFEKQLKTKNPNLKLMVLDDTYEKHFCDILLNHNIYASKKKYKKLVPKSCEVRCGAKYTLLRDEFKKARANGVNAKAKIVVMMGGSDTANLSKKVAKVLLKKDCTIDIVSTQANKNLKKLESFSKKHPSITLHIDTKNIASLIKSADLAIITPSVSANEVVFLKTPLISIKVAKNQRYMDEYLREKGYMSMKCFDGKKLEKFLEKLKK